ncbi:hypothetical protein, partial [Thiolapillus sp.]|uniref:hypothetical protein n=1 Tax=Thiolapillus sp. TaxID=2017437 RepID=UPI003AF783C5
VSEASSTSGLHTLAVVEQIDADLEINLNKSEALRQSILKKSLLRPVVAPGSQRRTHLSLAQTHCGGKSRAGSKGQS